MDIINNKVVEGKEGRVAVSLKRKTLGTPFLSIKTPLLNWLSVFILSFTALCYFSGLDNLTVQRFDESHYILNALDIVENGNWLAPTYKGNYDNYNLKPPLFPWMLAISFLIFGKNIIAARLVTAFFAWATGFLLYKFFTEKKLPLIGILSPLVLMLTPGWFDIHAARTADTDVVQAFFLLLSVLFLGRFAKSVQQQEKLNLKIFFSTIIILVFYVFVRGLISIIFPLFFAIIYSYTYKLSVRRILLYLSVFFISSIPLLMYYFYRSTFDELYLKNLLMIDFQRANLPIDGHDAPWYFYLKEFYTKDFGFFFPFIVLGFTHLFLMKSRANYYFVFGLGSLLILMLFSFSATKSAWYDVVLLPFIVAISLRAFFIVQSQLNKKRGRLLWNYFGIILIGLSFMELFSKISATYNSDWPNVDYQNDHFYHQLRAMDSLQNSINEVKQVAVSWPPENYHDELLVHIKFLNERERAKVKFFYVDSLPPNFNGSFLYFNHPKEVRFMGCNNIVWLNSKQFLHTKLYEFGKELYKPGEFNSFLKPQKTAKGEPLLISDGEKVGDLISFGPYLNVLKGNYTAGFSILPFDKNISYPFIFEVKDAAGYVYQLDTITIDRASSFKYQTSFILSRDAVGLELIVKHGLDNLSNKTINNFGLQEVFIHPLK